MSATREESWEQATTANDDIDAQLLAGVLDDAGIETRLVKNRSGYGDYLFGGSNPHAPVAIHVRTSQLDAARQAIDDAAEPEQVDESEPVRSQPAWPTVVAIAIVGLIVLAFLLQQRGLSF